MVKSVLRSCRSLRCIGLAAFAATAACAAVIAGVATASGPRSSLAQLERTVAEDHRGVAEITARELGARLADASRQPVLVDARQPDEYRVSRISGAIRVAPDAQPDQIREALKSSLNGRDVVIYCSVGVRSSRMVERAGRELREAGARAVFSLRGGIFRWHNERRPLRNAAGAVDIVHPYSSFWQRFLIRSDKTGYQPG